MINFPKYRAFYKHDLAAGDILPFYVNLYQDSLMFVMEEPTNPQFELKDKFAYDFSIPFLDDDWLVHRWTNFVDSEGIDIWEQDLVKFQYSPHSETLEGIVMWNDEFKILGIKSFSRESDSIIPFFNFIDNSGKLNVKTLGLHLRISSEVFLFKVL